VTISTSLPALPFEQPHPLQTAPLLRALQAGGPIHRVRTAVGDPAWLVTGYTEVRQLLGDDRLGMSHPDPDRAARANDSALFGGRPQGNYDTEHTDRARFRGLLQPFFTAKRMRALRPRVDALVTGLLDQVATQTPPVDLHQALAVPLPILVICELLGVPYEDQTRFRAFSQAAAAIGDQARSQAGLMDLWAYTRQLVGHKRAHPSDDVISGLCAVDGLDDDYIAMLAAMILFAGHETTVVQLGYGAVLLLTNPDQHHAVLADPQLLPAAVEECLRAGNSGGGGIPRYPRTTIQIAGVTIPAGDLILLDNGAANHDASVFADPHRFDLARPANPHLTFGHGGHYCIGAPLARVELEAVFAQLIPRFPTMRLAVPVEALQVRRDLLTGGLAELPVTW
jgi:pentalenolactone synthase